MKKEIPYVEGFLPVKVSHSFPSGKSIEFVICYKILDHFPNQENNLLDEITYLEIHNPYEFFQLKNYETIDKSIEHICSVKKERKLKLSNELQFLLDIKLKYSNLIR